MDVRIEEKRKSRTIQTLTTKKNPICHFVGRKRKKGDKIMARGQEDKWNKTVGVRAE
jgi:hypothetical protein